MKILSGKVALVTGSTSGIGLAIAHALAESGANLMLHGVGAINTPNHIPEEIARSYGVSVRLQTCDLRDPRSAETLVEETQKAFGSLDILINNAGIQFVSPIADFPTEQWDAIHAIVLSSSFRTIKSAISGMRERKWGRVINVVSAHGLVASPFKSAYVAAKHGQIGLTKSVALEVAEDGITCNAICPGYVRTPLVENQIEAQAKAHGLSREHVVRDVILSAQPTKRFIEVEEIAALVVFLCGEQARSITGSAIPVDGGWTAR
jgi:3-hydroxybutyrate dehydrogenase